MAQITITIPDAIATRVINKFAQANGYEATITDAEGITTPNPQTRAQFCKAKLIEHIRNTVAQIEANAAADTARQTALTQADTDITLS